jgi:hypothetical protein
MQSMKGSELRYRESERLYSFHSWEKRDWEEAREAWLRMK